MSPPATSEAVPTITDLLAEGRQRLQRAPFEISPRESLLLLGWTLGRSEASLLAHGEEPVGEIATASFRALVERRSAGQPVAYLTGQREFYGRSFLVDSRVLIPRPETEHLVELAVCLALPERPSIIDLGTGSGCLAVTLALELPGSRVVAVDRSLAALRVAHQNAERLGASHAVRCLLGDWARSLDLRSVDLIVANPPYLAEREAPALSTEIRDHEPAPALFAGRDGLDAYRHLLRSCQPAPRTALLLELGAGQSRAVADLAQAGDWVVVGSRPDLAGHDRVLHLRRSTSISAALPFPQTDVASD